MSNTLHIINKPICDNLALFKSCASALSKGDAIMFIESSVLALQEAQLETVFYKNKQTNIHFFVLVDDLATRNISNHAKYMNEITMDEFVELTEKYSKSISWF